jgi:hypothetical protein
MSQTIRVELTWEGSGNALEVRGKALSNESIRTHELVQLGDFALPILSHGRSQSGEVGRVAGVKPGLQGLILSFHLEGRDLRKGLGMDILDQIVLMVSEGQLGALQVELICSA